MPLQFRKRVKLAKGMYLNLSKSGVSMSVGTKGARMTIGKKGVTESFGISGTGLSYRKQQSWKAMAPTASSKTIVLPDKDREAQRLALARATAFDPRLKALRSFVYIITIFLWGLIAITGDHSPVILGYTIFASLYCIVAVISIRALKKTPPRLPANNEAT